MTDWAVSYIRAVLKAKDWTPADLARAAGVSHSTINRPLTVKDYPNAISRKTIASVYAASGIDPAPFTPKGEVVAVVDRKASAAPGMDLVPVYNVRASAGPGAFVADPEEVVDRLAFPPGYLRNITSASPKDLAIISVKGRSMEPTLREDDVVMIDMAKRDLSFEGIFVIRDGGQSMLVKRISRASRRGFVMLVSDNRDHPAVERSLEDIEVIGKVVWAGVKM